MKREHMWKQAKSAEEWDVIIIGGGATGLGAAVDACSRGFRTLLLEKEDFAKGSSSRSTKLIHGGVRYLKQGNLSLVKEGLKERGLLYQNAPHLMSKLPLLIPHYHPWEKAFYGLGMKFYDLLAQNLNLAPSQILGREETLLKIPTLRAKNLCGSTLFFDGQFDDARLALHLALTAANLGGVLCNYTEVISFIKKQDLITGVLARDTLSGEEIALHAKVVINATGVFTDALCYLDSKIASNIIAPSQGIHLVLPRKFLPSDSALLIPKTEDGRLLFCIPWHRHLLFGTTDTPVNQIDPDPKPLEEEIDFLLHHAAKTLETSPQREDVLSVFAGLRPLVYSKGKKGAKLSRSHEIFVSPSKLVTIAGGKWTTYRKMGEEAISCAIRIGNLPNVLSATENLKLHGYEEKHHALDAWSMYGTDKTHLEKIAKEHPHLNQFLHPDLPYKKVEVIWAVRNEMAMTLDDVLSRRIRALFLNADAALSIAPQVVTLMAEELKKDKKWEQEQTQNFQKIANHFLCRRG